MKSHRLTWLDREKGLAEIIDLAYCESTASMLARKGRYRPQSLEWRILGVLGKRDGLLMSDLGKRAAVRQPTLSKAIDRMAAAKLLRRRTSSADHRRALIHLTEQGQQLARQLISDTRQHEVLIARALGNDRTRKVKVELARLISLLEQVPSWVMGSGTA